MADAIAKLAAELMNLPEAEWQRLAACRRAFPESELAQGGGDHDMEIAPEVGAGETAARPEKD